ncbi:MAG TPA: hypothetical protein VFX17_02090 [Patescibacteria group bacterium]|nr:hypothetical protein [Patescibacteria group bacterium]
MDQEQHTTVLKELSDIKSSLAVNTNETANIKQSIAEIKLDIREIKTDFVTRREFNDAIKTLREEDPSPDHETRLRAMERFRWLVTGALIILNIIGDYILYSVLKK